MKPSLSDAAHVVPRRFRSKRRAVSAQGTRPPSGNDCAPGGRLIAFDKDPRAIETARGIEEARPARGFPACEGRCRPSGDRRPRTVGRRRSPRYCR
ncbi:hypothetical protein DF051_16480 [Burkholderia contaminans]|uniref:Uncharacterized protein n=1 Tax=Burkholderia contaminans TaxID=488447 RepID=A0A3N8PVP6_9BURK|nr:hypothetical protein DF051_16480 [Burkholderia contaminans]